MYFPRQESGSQSSAVLSGLIFQSVQLLLSLLLFLPPLKLLHSKVTGTHAKPRSAAHQIRGCLTPPFFQPLFVLVFICARENGVPRLPPAGSTADQWPPRLPFWTCSCVCTDFSQLLNTIEILMQPLLRKNRASLTGAFSLPLNPLSANRHLILDSKSSHNLLPLFKCAFLCV